MIGLLRVSSFLRLYFCGVTTLIILTAVGCSDATQPDSTPDSSIRGTVVDANDQPISGAGILVSLWPSIAPIVPGQGPVRLGHSGKSASTLVEMHVTDFCGILVRNLCPGEGHQPGDPVLIDGKNNEGMMLNDGIYFVRATYSDTVVVQDFLLVRNPDITSSLATNAVWATTDEAGRFRFSQDCLPFEYDFELPELRDAVTISRWIYIQAVDTQDSKATSDSVYVDATRGTEITVHFP